MEKVWLKREGNPDLVLYMLGWAATPNAVLHIDPPGCDVLACYDYRSLEPLAAAEFSHYRRIYLFAWSFGVWVAEQCCRELPLCRAVALNGTPFPVDERYGMRLRAVQRSMRARAKHGGANAFDDGTQTGVRYAPKGPFADRSIEEQIRELEQLAEWSHADSAAHLHWDAAFIGDKDEVFPPERMRAWWHSVGLGTEFASYHYPFANPQIVLGQIAQATTAQG